MAFAKFQENRFRIDGEIAKNHAILVNLTASIVCMVVWVNRTAQKNYRAKQVYFISVYLDV